MKAYHPISSRKIRLVRIAFCLAILSIFPGCAVVDGIRVGSERRAEEKRIAALRAESLATHAAWRSSAGWKSKTYRNPALIALANSENSQIEIALKEQRGLLLVDGLIAMDFPVATGKRSHPTPTGSFTVIGKQKDYGSNLYGKIVDAAGTVLVADADTRTDVIPEGATFVPAKMPYWMRLTNTGVGLHVGYIPGRPASHGCIRLKRDVAVQLFGITRIGTPVVIADVAPTLSEQPKP
jgi:hypothetical protein